MDALQPTPALSRLQAVARDPHAVARAAKARGQKVIGTRCLFVPEELITAAGMLAHPLLGAPEPVGPADSYFQSCTCEFVRNVFDHALAGKLDFLDGLCLANTCDVVRRLTDIWRRYLERIPAALIVNPQKLCEEGNRAYWVTELRNLRAQLGRWAGREVDDASLRGAIAAHNRTRALLREIYSLRKAAHPPLRASEALEVCLAAWVLPRDEANPLLEQLLRELQAREPDRRAGPRVLVTGSLLDHPALLSMIEEEGALVVADDLCTTARTFWHLVEPDPDPVVALWRHQNRRPLCACMHPTEARQAYLEEMVAEYRVDAVVYFTLKYCHPFLYEAPLAKKALAAKGVPTTVLEVGHDLSGHGQLRTRIQAFVEMLEC